MILYLIPGISIRDLYSAVLIISANFQQIFSVKLILLSSVFLMHTFSFQTII